MQDFDVFMADESEISTSSGEDEDHDQEKSKGKYTSLLGKDKNQSKIKKTKDWNTVLTSSSSSSDIEDIDKSDNVKGDKIKIIL